MNHHQKKKAQKQAMRARNTRRYLAWRTRIRKDVNVGDIVEDCGLHIGIVLEVDRNNGDLRVQSILTGKIGCCDLYHCGIIVQTTKQIRQKIALFNEGGMEALADLYHSQY